MSEKYIKVPIVVLTSKLRPESKILLCLFLNHMFLNGPDKPIKQPLTWYKNKLNISEKAVRTGLGELTDKGLIEKKQGKPNSYRFSPCGQIYPSSRADKDSSRADKDAVWADKDSSWADKNAVWADCYTLYKKSNKKINKKSNKERGEEARARTHEAPKYDSSLFRKVSR